jgi:hypothetical protein
MKIIISGGSGQVGRMLIRGLEREGHECVVLSRTARSGATGTRTVAWDGWTLGPWAAEIDGADAVINLAGRSVDCRYTKRHLDEMLRSRTDSVRVVGEAIARSARPPRVWLQAGTATIYAHRFDEANDELTGRIGGDEPDAPPLWRKSVEIAQAWEAELAAAPTRRTRKVVMRSAMTMSPDCGGVFSVLARLARAGVGRQGSGSQYVSWIHEYDFTAAVKFLLQHEELDGAFNLCAPEPLTNADFMAVLHQVLGRRLAVPVPRWPLELGAFFLRTETELILKSRRVVPTRLRQAGFTFRYPDWPVAAVELTKRGRG